jgi:thiamine-phosphate diphosphorylase
MRKGRQIIADQWKLYVILGREGDPLQIADAALRGGARVLQYRGKEKPGSLQLTEASELRKLTHRYGAALIINDRTDMAFLADADGLHLGEGDLPIAEARRMLGSKKLIGATAHSLDQASRAEEEGADYIGFGSVFHTGSKSDTMVRGLRSLTQVVRQSRLPVIGIGGIQGENVNEVMQTGVAGVAVLSAVSESDDPEAAARELVKRITC